MRFHTGTVQVVFYSLGRGFFALLRCVMRQQLQPWFFCFYQEGTTLKRRNHLSFFFFFFPSRMQCYSYLTKRLFLLILTYSCEHVETIHMHFRIMGIPSHIQGVEVVIFLETNVQQNSLVIKSSPIWTGWQHLHSISNLEAGNLSTWVFVYTIYNQKKLAKCKNYFCRLQISCATEMVFRVYYKWNSVINDSHFTFNIGSNMRNRVVK